MKKNIHKHGNLKKEEESFLPSPATTIEKTPPNPNNFIFRLEEAGRSKNRKKIKEMLHCLQKLYQEGNFLIKLPAYNNWLLKFLFFDQNLFELLMQTLAIYLKNIWVLNVPKEGWDVAIQKLLVIKQSEKILFLFEIEEYRKLFKYVLNKNANFFMSEPIPQITLLHEILVNDILTDEFIEDFAAQHPENLSFQCALKFSKFLNLWGEVVEDFCIPLIEAFTCDFDLAARYLELFIVNTSCNPKVNYQRMADILIMLKGIYNNDKNKQQKFHTLLVKVFPLDFDIPQDEILKDNATFKSNKEKTAFFKTEFLPQFPGIDEMKGDNQVAKNYNKPDEAPLIIKDSEIPTESRLYYFALAEIEIWDLQVYGFGVAYVLQIPVNEINEAEIHLLKEVANSNQADWKKRADLRLAQIYLSSGEPGKKTLAEPLLIRYALLGCKISINLLSNFFKSNEEIKNIVYFINQYLVDQIIPSADSIKILAGISKKELDIIEKIIFSNVPEFQSAIHYLGALYYSPQFVCFNSIRALYCWEMAAEVEYQPSLEAVIETRNANVMRQVADFYHDNKESEKTQLVAIGLYGLIVQHALGDSTECHESIAKLKNYVTADQESLRAAARHQLAKIYKKTQLPKLKKYARHLFFTKLSKEGLLPLAVFKRELLTELKILKQIHDKKVRATFEDMGEDDEKAYLKEKTMIQAFEKIWSHRENNRNLSIQEIKNLLLTFAVKIQLEILKQIHDKKVRATFKDMDEDDKEAYLEGKEMIQAFEEMWSHRESNLNLSIQEIKNLLLTLAAKIQNDSLQSFKSLIDQWLNKIDLLDSEPSLEQISTLEVGIIKNMF